MDGFLQRFEGVRVSEISRTDVWVRLAEGSPTAIPVSRRALEGDLRAEAFTKLVPAHPDVLPSDFILFRPTGEQAIENAPITYGRSNDKAYALYRKTESDGGLAPILAAVASTIVGDMGTSGNLQLQRTSTGLGSLLLAPLPLSSLDSAIDSPPVLAAELLPYVGSFKSYEEAVANSYGGRQQKRHVVAVVQASGSGKSRLAYAVGMASTLVVFVRIQKQHTGLTPAWARYGDLARDWSAQQQNCAVEGRRIVSKHAMAAMRLLVCCYVDWVVRVLEAMLASEFPSVNMLDVESDHPAAAACREAALRCLRNGRGDAAVGLIFDARLASLAGSVQVLTGLDGRDIAVRAVDADGVSKLCGELETRLRARLWLGAEVLVSYDEVDALYQSAFPKGLFQNFTAYTSLDTADIEEVGCFHGLTALMADLLDEHRWGQSMCGTWLRLAVSGLSAWSPLHNRTTHVFHASRIEPEDMEQSLRTFFDLGTDATFFSSLRGKLAQLRGRPIFFFDCVWGSVWKRLCRRWRDSSRTGELDLSGLHALLLAAADEGLTEACGKCAVVVANLWDPSTASVTADGKSTTAFCQELYAAARMNDGHVLLGSNGAGAQALQAGLLALPLTTPSDTAVSIALGDEPLMRDAIITRGDAEVRASARDPDKDPVLALLTGCMTSGAIAGFALTTSIKGGVFKLAFVWHVLRSVILAGGPVKLGAALHALDAGGFRLPDATASLIVRATRALPRSMLPHDASDFHFLVGDVGDAVVVYNVSTAAGADVIFAARHASAHAPQLRAVLVQLKAQKDATLDDCLRAASPSWQYVQKAERGRIIGGERVVNWVCQTRGEYEALVSANPAVFNSAIRVAVSVNSFQPWVTRMIEELNETDEMQHSPIALCTSSAGAFGKRMHGILRDECKGNPTASTDHITYLLPHSVAAVSDATISEVAPSGMLSIIKKMQESRAAASAPKGAATKAAKKLALLHV